MKQSDLKNGFMIGCIVGIGACMLIAVFVRHFDIIRVPNYPIKTERGSTSQLDPSMRELRTLCQSFIHDYEQYLVNNYGIVPEAERN